MSRSLFILGWTTKLAQQCAVHKAYIGLQVVGSGGPAGTKTALPDFQNQSQQVRCVDITMETWSVFYTGSKAHLVKRGVGEFDLQPNERKPLMLGMGPIEGSPIAEYLKFGHLAP